MVKNTAELLSPIVASNTSVSEVMRKLGLANRGGNHTHLSKRIKTLGLDTAHFVGVGHRKGVPSIARRTWQAILILRSSTESREKTSVLRRALIESGREYRCKCGQGPEWNGLPLTLQIDHGNGLIYDDRPENLSFICPNCHTQTETYARVKVNVGRRCVCGKRIKNSRNKSGKCWDCGRGKKAG